MPLSGEIEIHNKSRYANYVNPLFSTKYKVEPPSAGFQASAAMYMRTALFWAVTQRRELIHYRRFGTTKLLL